MHRCEASRCLHQLLLHLLLLQLGHLEKHEGNFEDAIHCYEQANHIAEQQGEIGTLKRINCHIGMARGNLGLNTYMEDLARKAEAASLQ